MLTRQINKYIKSFASSATVRHIACGQHKRQISIMWNPMTVCVCKAIALLCQPKRLALKSLLPKRALSLSLCLNQERKSGLKQVSKESRKKKQRIKLTISGTWTSSLWKAQLGESKSKVYRNFLTTKVLSTWTLLCCTLLFFHLLSMWAYYVKLKLIYKICCKDWQTEGKISKLPRYRVICGKYA